MDFNFTEEQRMLIEAVDKFGQKWQDKGEEIRERTLKEGVFPRDFWQEFADQGFIGALIPEEYGGSGMGLFAQALILETLGRYGLTSAMMMLTAMDALCVLRGGPDELKQRYLPRIASGEEIWAFAITEPDAGSNAFRMKTIARREGDKFILNGQKTFITGVDVADRVLVIARSMTYEELKAKGLPKVGGFNVLIVDPKSPGFEMQELNTEGIEGLRQWTLFFDNVEVPAEDLVGAEHAGILPMFNVLNAERTLAAAIGLGGIDLMLKKAVDYANERVVFGDKPIGAYQAIQHPLAEIKAESEAARMLVYRAAAMFDEGKNPNDIAPYANMAKMLVGEISIKACDRAIQTHGGNGFDRDYGLIQAWVNTRLVRTAPISKEMILNYIAEHVLGMPRSY
ncbi:MAG: acyl-CoA dehydrogenase [Candidatus Dadabacteria bacterium]|nr:MAG: acyl-CoA dehydrogenase [Candidatus Dadabacteria bacterium]